VWIPYARGREAIDDVGLRTADRESRSLLAIGRLADGVRLDQAQQEVHAIGARLDAEYPIGSELAGNRRLPFNTSRVWRLVPTAEAQLEADFVLPLIVYGALGAVFAVLLVSCTNVANLALARVARQRDAIAVRHVLGASRGRLIRAEFMTGILVAIGGGVVGLGVARLLSVILSAPIRMGGVVLEVDVRLHVASFFIALGMAALSVVLFSLAPTLGVISKAVRGTVSWTSSQRVAPRWRIRRGLIGIQVAVSTMLVAFVLLAMQQIHASTQDLGVDLDRLAGVDVGLAAGGFEEVEGRLLIEQALVNARSQIPSEDLALASFVPFSPTRGSIFAMRPDDMERRVGAQRVSGTATLFGVMGLDFVRGRPFEDREAAAAEAVVTEDLAENLFGTVDILGSEIFTRRQPTVAVPDPPVKSFRIVGVVERIRGDIVGRQRPYLFLPWSTEYDDRVTILTRTLRDPGSIVGDLVQAVVESDARAVIVAQGTGRTLAEVEHVIQKTIAGTGGMISAIALVLALGGLYGVLSYAVTMRRRELGIRLAIGADRKRIFRTVIGEGIRPVAIGVAAGLFLAVIAWWRIGPISTALFPSANFLALAALPVPLLLAGAVACYLPARRAARTDPILALRDDR
jgi:putative ABC transport system permease protein